MKRECQPTIRLDIYMAGDIATARQACREYCRDVGFCVHIEQVDYIYTGGAESGFKVGIINYPRFPASLIDLRDRAREIADYLLVRCCQSSCCIVGPEDTWWYSLRDDVPTSAEHVSAHDLAGKDSA